jgi:hypothetical protein
MYLKGVGAAFKRWPVVEQQSRTVVTLKPGPRPRRAHRRVKPQLVKRGDLDGRSNAAKYFDQLVREIETDLGGADQLSTIERSLIEAFVGGRLWIDNFNCRAMAGEQVDVLAFAATANCIARLGSRLGVRRRPRNLNPSLAELLADDERVEKLRTKLQRAEADVEDAEIVDDGGADG